LVTGVVGFGVALKRGHEYHVGPMHGSPDHVARDSLHSGTALSAPAYMLVAQALATRRVGAGRPSNAERVLGWLGLSMTAGYLGETLVRSRLRPSGFDPVETPLLVAAIALSSAMAALGLGRRRV
jgi:hypothetical protein